MFRNREDAALQLAEQLKGHLWHDPLVLGIPRGGVVVAAVLAQQLGADLDVVLARKLRAPFQPEWALGAISETGAVHLNDIDQELSPELRAYLARETRVQRAEIERRRKLYRAVRPAAPMTGRSVIVTDDGIATGSTMMAALKVARSHQPRELIVAVPVAAANRLAEVSTLCDDVVCLHASDSFWAIGEFFEDFTQIEDEQVVELLRSFAHSGKGTPV